MQGLVWTGVWVYSPGSTFSWTARISGLNGANVSAEISLGQVVTYGGNPSHAKGWVSGTTWIGGPRHGMSTTWGPDWGPIQFIDHCGSVSFMLETQRAYSWATCKAYIH
jgi:hypothetical protein